MATKKSFTASVAPFDEVFHDPEWTYVNRAQLQDCSKFFDADPNVVTGFNFRMDALLNGGIIFKRKGKSMQGHAKDWMSEQFSKFLKDVVRNRWFAGFAACAWEEEAEFVGRPVVLDLTQVTVRYRLSVFGRAEFRYFWQPRDGISAEVEIKNVMTFSWDPPDSAGNLRSLVLLLAQDHMHETLLSYYSIVAMKGRALPVMITERDKEVYDRENIRAPMARSPTEIAMGMLSGSRQEEATENPERSNVIIQHTEDFFSRTQPAMTDTILTNLASINHMPHFASHYQLAQGRKFTAAPLPEAPTDLLTFRVARLERACALMGVPLAMLTNSTSTGGKKMSEGENSNSYILFENAQQALKLELIRCATALFYSIYLKSHLEEYMTTTPTKDWKATDAASSAEVTVEIPSLPNQDQLIDWYTRGWLRYETMTDYLSSRHGISPDSFHKTPQLDIKEQNGEFETAQPAAKKAKK